MVDNSMNFDHVKLDDIIQAIEAKTHKKSVRNKPVKSNKAKVAKTQNSQRRQQQDTEHTLDDYIDVRYVLRTQSLMTEGKLETMKPEAIIREKQNRLKQAQRNTEKQVDAQPKEQKDSDVINVITKGAGKERGVETEVGGNGETIIRINIG